MFKNVDQYESYLKALINRHYSDIKLILNRLGLDAEPTPQILHSAWLSYGNDFAKMVALLPEENADGKGWDKLAKIFESGSKVVNSAAGIYGTVQGTLNRQQAGLQSPGQVWNMPPPEPEPTPVKSDTTKIIIIGAIVVAVLVVVFIIIKNRKS